MLDSFIHVWAVVLLCICAATFVFSGIAAGFGLFGVNFFDRFEEYDGRADQILTVLGLIVLSNLALIATLWLLEVGYHA